jgi:SAM-dependent methyltransferase
VTGPAPFAGSSFGAPPARAAWFAAAVARRVEAGASLRVLDIGCGTGAHVFALAERMPRALFRGIDLSEANIAAAEGARGAHPAAQRVAFSCADYLRFEGGTFDLIVSDSALHLIEGPTGALLAKLAAELAAGGLLVASLPDGGPGNRALWLARRFLAAIRGPWLDAIALRIATAAYGARHDEAFLRERIPYLYLAPRRFEGPKLREQARAHGLVWRESAPAPRDSFMQPRHVLTVYGRAA